MEGNLRLFVIALLCVGLVPMACGKQQQSAEINPTYTATPSIIPTRVPTPIPSPMPKPKPTATSTPLECSDIVRALKVGGQAWSKFYESSLGAPIQFSGYVFELDTEKDLISILSDECNIEIWLKGIPHSTVIYTSYTQIVSGNGTIEAYPDLTYMDEVLVNVDLDTLEIR